MYINWKALIPKILKVEMKLLHLNLSDETFKILDVPKELEIYVGGKGIASKLLFNIPKGIDPFHPENALIFAIGPLNGI